MSLPPFENPLESYWFLEMPGFVHVKMIDHFLPNGIGVLLRKQTRTPTWVVPHLHQWLRKADSIPALALLAWERPLLAVSYEGFSRTS